MDERIGTYQSARRKFSLTVYLLTTLWLILAITQWLIVDLIKTLDDFFEEHEWISVIFFALAIALIVVYIFVEKVRFITGLNWVMTIVIIECPIVGLFALVARSHWPDMLMWFIICILLLFLCILVGAVIPHDMTLDVVILFVVSFVFLIASVFVLMIYVLIRAPYAFIMYQLIVSLIILAFVMYHAQTITGGRFAEMRVNDYLLASVILFYDFIVIFLLTFYVQTKYKIASDAINMSNDDDDETTQVFNYTTHYEE